MNLDAILTVEDLQIMKGATNVAVSDKGIEIRYIPPETLRRVLAESEKLWEMLAEVEPHWSDYKNVWYCNDCCRITDAASFWNTLQPTDGTEDDVTMPHKDDCVHELIARAMKKAGRVK